MFIDMHSHSVSSDDSRATVEQYLKWVQVLRKKGYQIDAIVLTEHRKFDRQADYSALAKDYAVLVFKGSELDTRYGHFLVYGVTERLLKAVTFSDISLDPLCLMQEARSHGAFAVPAHPGRPGIGLCKFVEDGVHFDGVDTVEVLNGGSRAGENERAQGLAKERGYRGIAGSDAHFVSAIGSCLTYFPGAIRTEAELAEALRAGDFKPLRLEETKQSGTTAGEAK